jgi:hypothetical protein
VALRHSNLWPLDHHVYFVSSIIGTVGLDVIGFVRLVPFRAVFGGGDTGRRVSVARGGGPA